MVGYFWDPLVISERQALSVVDAKCEVRRSRHRAYSEIQDPGGEGMNDRAPFGLIVRAECTHFLKMSAFSLDCKTRDVPF